MKLSGSSPISSQTLVSNSSRAPTRASQSPAPSLNPSSTAANSTVTSPSPISPPTSSCKTTSSTCTANWARPVRPATCSTKCQREISSPGLPSSPDYLKTTEKKKPFDYTHKCSNPSSTRMSSLWGAFSGAAPPFPTLTSACSSTLNHLSSLPVIPHPYRTL